MRCTECESDGRANKRVFEYTHKQRACVTLTGWNECIQKSTAATAWGPSQPYRSSGLQSAPRLVRPWTPWTPDMYSVHQSGHLPDIGVSKLILCHSLHSAIKVPLIMGACNLLTDRVSRGFGQFHHHCHDSLCCDHHTSYSSSSKELSFSSPGSPVALSRHW